MNNANEDILLGIDYGETNIGLAFGRNGLVSPIKTISGKNSPIAINEILRVTIQNKISKLIVGLPLNYDRKETNQSRKVRQFAKLLKIRLKLPLEYIDEYGSTVESLEDVIQQNVPKKARRVIDHYSAALLLKKYYLTRLTVAPH